MSYDDEYYPSTEENNEVIRERAQEFRAHVLRAYSQAHYLYTFCGDADVKAMKEEFEALWECVLDNMLG